jgi:hypothetical protein
MMALDHFRESGSRPSFTTVGLAYEARALTASLPCPSAIAPRAQFIEVIPPQTGKANKSLIATVRRLEIVVTHSYKRRKHFLTATKSRSSFAPETRFQLPKVAKISHKSELIEPPVSHSKQWIGTKLNRKLSVTLSLIVSRTLRSHPKRFTSHKSRVTDHGSHV